VVLLRAGTSLSDIVVDEKTPKQKNGWDCGVFTCITAERLTGEVGRMNYGQDHMDRLREYMVAEIIDGVFYH
jgi:Ulp1 family protease